MPIQVTGVQIGVAGSSSLALNDLSDVSIASPLDGQYLRYNASLSSWQNAYLDYDVFNYLSTKMTGSGGVVVTYTPGANTINVGLTLTPTNIKDALGFTPVNVAGDTMLGPLILAGDPTDLLGAATKQYVDNLAGGLLPLASCVTATTSTLAIASAGTVTYSNGTAGVGATLTTTGSFANISGAALATNDRVLVKNEAAPANNGIYVKTSNTVLTRAADYDNSPSSEINAGDFVFIAQGTLSGFNWVQTTPAPVTVGTTPIAFTQLSGPGSLVGGPGINVSGNVISNTGVLSAAGTANQISVSPTTGAVIIGLPSAVTISGMMTAASFSGTGTGLTGNAAGLSIGGNSATATALQVARTINGVPFNGTANIIIPASTSAALTMSNSGAGAASGTTFDGSAARTISYNSIGAAPLTGVGTSGLWPISVTGSAGDSDSTSALRVWDGSLKSIPTSAIATSGTRSNDLAPSTYKNGIFSEFKQASVYGVSGNFAGLVTIAPWNGTTAGGGDANYSLLFSAGSAVAGAPPALSIRSGIDATWGAWSTFLHTSNYNNYAPTRTGIGASGTWNINTTGSIGTQANILATGTIRAGDLPNGSVTLAVGNTSTSGYISFISGGNVRQGFIGNSTTTAVLDQGEIKYAAGSHNFFGVVNASNGITSNGDVTLSIGGINVQNANAGGSPVLEWNPAVSTTGLFPTGWSEMGGGFRDIMMIDANAIGANARYQIQYNIGLGFAEHVFSIGGQPYRMNSSGTGTSPGGWVAISDRRVTDNLAVIPDALTKVGMLTGYTYSRNDLPNNPRMAGYIAQDVQPILPEGVSSVISEDSVQRFTVDHNAVIGILINAIKELNTKVDSLNAEIQSLRGGG